MRIRTAAAAAALMIFCASARGAEELVTLPVRDGVTQSYLLLHDTSAMPKVIVVTLIGGTGAIDLPKRMREGVARFSPGANFLIRIREKIAGADIADAIVDAPSDRLPNGMTDEFRSSEQHASDVRKIIADLHARFPQARILLVGTSRGTISAVHLARALGDVVQGAILSSTVTVADRVGPGLSGFDFTSIKIPVLWLHHHDDGCRSSPYAGAERAARGGAFISVSGGDPPQSGPCEPLSPHGYFGREDATVEAIRNYLLNRDFAREIR